MKHQPFIRICIKSLKNFLKNISSFGFPFWKAILHEPHVYRGVNWQFLLLQYKKYLKWSLVSKIGRYLYRNFEWNLSPLNELEAFLNFVFFFYIFNTILFHNFVYFINQTELIKFHLIGSVKYCPNFIFIYVSTKLLIAWLLFSQSDKFWASS